jgi:hypothetical protein
MAAMSFHPKVRLWLCRQHYGEAQPPDVAGYYGLLDCPVDICAGRADGVIAKENVRAPSWLSWHSSNPRRPR